MCVYVYSCGPRYLKINDISKKIQIEEQTEGKADFEELKVKPQYHYR